MAVESPHRPGTDHSGPTRLGRWDVVAKIASGGMSSIYLGRQVEPGPDPHEPRMVALKVLRHEVRDDPRVIKMFLTEGQLLVRLVHPNIVRTLEVHVDDERGFIAMELLLGQSIAAIQDACVERGLRLNPEIAAFCVARVADALQYANEITDDDGRPLDIIHRDVTPQNVFVSYAGEVKLIDFGMAKIVDGSITGPNLLVGKLPYLAPEQIQQMPLDHRTDIFALGVTFWELLTAKRLFRRNTDEETIEAVRSGRIPDVREVAPEVPEEIARIVATALERDRDKRYWSTSELAYDLDAFLVPDVQAGMGERLSALVHTLYPDEYAEQQGWLVPPPGSSHSVSLPPAPPAPPSSRSGLPPMPPSSPSLSESVPVRRYTLPPMNPPPRFGAASSRPFLQPAAPNDDDT